MSEAVEQERKIITEVFESLHAKIRVIRDHHGCNIPEAFQRFALPGIEREYRRIVKKLHEEEFGELGENGGA